MKKHNIYILVILNNPQESPKRPTMKGQTGAKMTAQEYQNEVRVRVEIAKYMDYISELMR